jgi:hypothetical protein
LLAAIFRNVIWQGCKNTAVFQLYKNQRKQVNIYTKMHSAQMYSLNLNKKLHAVVLKIYWGFGGQMVNALALHL